MAFNAYRHDLSHLNTDTLVRVRSNSSDFKCINLWLVVDLSIYKVVCTSEQGVTCDQVTVVTNGEL